MRVFWIIMGVLAAAAAVIAFAQQRDDRRDVKVDASRQEVHRTPVEPAATQPPAPAQPVPDDVEALIKDLMGISGTDADAGADADDGDTGIESGSNKSLDSALATGEEEAAAAAKSFDPANPVDGTYIVGGSGTTDAPFEITWDLLLLAAQAYVPREGRTEIPPLVQAIDGSHIRIEGYFAFPLASTDAREVLFMLNMWDGCCIGVPPSPYDAIEVRLKEPMGDGGKLFVNYGTLSGVLKVDPYVQDGWLLGIYLMQDGVIDVGL